MPNSRRRLRRAHSLPTRYGRWALVAGASEGLGAAFAEQLASRGMHLVLIARRGHLLAELAGRLTAEYGTEVRCLPLDLSDPGFADTVEDAVAGLDLGIVIYNAAYVPVGPFVDTGEDAIERAVDVNVHGPLRLLRALLPAMRDRGRGAVVLMSSLSGLQGSPHVSVYAATKSFNAILAEGLWHELRPHGVEVTSCCAGAMRTPGYNRSFDRDVPGMRPCGWPSSPRQCCSPDGRSPGGRTCRSSPSNGILNVHSWGSNPRRCRTANAVYSAAVSGGCRVTSTTWAKS